MVGIQLLMAVLIMATFNGAYIAVICMGFMIGNLIFGLI
jgi:hypothetical protein